MSAIEIKLDPETVAALMVVIRPAIDQLNDELATPVVLPEEDEMLEGFWKKDLLESQREEIAVIARLMDDDFPDTGRIVLEPEDLDAVIRSCSALRLRLRDTVLGSLSDEDLEHGDFEGVEWTRELQLGYGAYALFASLQEVVVQHLDPEQGRGPPDEEGL